MDIEGNSYLVCNDLASDMKLVHSISELGHGPVQKFLLVEMNTFSAQSL